MRRAALLVIGVLCGCGGGEQAAPPAEQAKTPATAPAPGGEAAAPANMSGTMTNTEVFLFDAGAEPGEARKPRVALKAEVFRRMDDGAWSFENAQAVMRGSGDEGSEITFQARQGRYEENKSAYLRNGVTAQAGTMALELQDIEVDSVAEGGMGVAHTDNPLVVNDPRIQVQAKSLRLYPDERKFELKGVTGKVNFEEVTP
jgi:hypothetical protein